MITELSGKPEREILIPGVFSKTVNGNRMALTNTVNGGNPG
jgi:hypothetical protein